MNEIPESDLAEMVAVGARGWFASIVKPKDGWRTVDGFTEVERARLWPIAETLAMLDGNAFFTLGGEYQADHVAQYLPEASALYEANGGDSGWAGEARLATPITKETVK